MYLYLVSFVALLMMVFSAVNLVRAAVDLAIPPVPPVFIEPRATPGVDSAEERRRAEASERQYLAERRRSGIVQIVGSAALFLIAAPLYVYHWRLAQGGESAS